MFVEVQEAVDEAAAVPISEVSSAVPKHVAKNLLEGTSALGAGIVIERGFGFLANLLAARLGGAGTFGAYSLGISTANNISAYAAGGIGSTAIRFSGKCPNGSQGYSTLSRALLIISLASAAIAALGLWAGAGPIAHLLGKQSLTGVLRWAALSAAGMILLECCRGFLVGQRRLAAILLLSLTVGIGMIGLLPLAARLGPTQMICSQGAITLGAVLLCLAFYRPLGLAPTSKAITTQPVGPMLRTVWSFGLIQLAGLVGMNAAGWWLTSLVARADSSMVQMGFFAVAHQLRNAVSLAPGLLTESSLAVMAQGEDDIENTPGRVMAVCMFATTLASLLLAGLGIVFAPWALTFLYGKSYGAASAAASIALATAVVHMGSEPASARLSLLSIKLSGVIKTIWAVMVAVSATTFLFWTGNAMKGALIYLAAHVVSAGLVLLVLANRHCLPRGVSSVFFVGSGTAISLAGLALFRNTHPFLTLSVSAAMLTLCLASLCLLLNIGHRHHWTPKPRLIVRLLRNQGFLPQLAVESSNSGGFDA